MLGKRRIIMVGATFFLAAATGHLMGGGMSFMAPEKSAPATKVAAVPKAATVTGIVPLAARPTEAAPATASQPPDAKRIAAPDIATRSDSDPTALPKPANPAPEESLADCAAVLTLSPAPAAMIDVSLNAPCDTSAPVVLRHAGLAISGLTSETGLLRLTIPALATRAHVEIALPNGVKSVGDVDIPSLVDYDRIGVQWQGGDQFELHAFEFGADYGEPGHVSALNPRAPTAALQAVGGFMTELGDGSVPLPMLAEVYTFPSARMKKAGDVELTIEAQVSAATCDRELLGETLEARSGQPVKLVDLTLSMPDCTAEGDYVVLNNLLQDVKVAGN